MADESDLRSRASHTAGNCDISPTGAERDSRKGKGRFDEISPHMLQRVARLLEHGAARHPDGNYRKGFTFSRCLDSAKRHTNNFELGIEDPDHRDNLAAIICNIMFIIHAQEMIASGVLPDSLDDRPFIRRSRGDKAAQTLPSPNRRNPAVPPSVGRIARGRVYVSGPFNAPTVVERMANLLAATWFGLILMRGGFHVHVPHAATAWWHGILDYEAFMQTDLSYLEHWATAVYCVAPSPGTDREVRRARYLGLPVWSCFGDVPWSCDASRITPDMIDRYVRDAIAAVLGKDDVEAKRRLGGYIELERLVREKVTIGARVPLLGNEPVLSAGDECPACLHGSMIGKPAGCSVCGYAEETK